ncbi:potassium-transporting ATPase subunit beta [Gastrophryne carolinensis]
MATFNEKKSCSQRMEDFGRFVWNPDTGEFMGRTLVKWVYISLYYVAFYIVMIGVFALSIYCLMQSLSMYEPYYQDQLRSPGVTIRPDVYGDEGIELYYNMNNNKTYEDTVKSLIKFLSLYNTTKQEEMNVNCTGAKNVTQLLMKGVSGKTRRACQFTETELGECAYNPADKDPFGYQKGQPCVFIKINRIIHFVPRNHSTPRLKCTPTVSETTWGVKYFPEDATYNLQYFPYYGKKAQPNYTNPLVAVKFMNITYNKEIEVQCKVHADGITTDNVHDPYEGKVTFRINIKN